MCGISALISSHISTEEKKVKISNSLKKMASRGPDGAGIWTDGEATLGHVRLSIIDIAGSHQPMATDDERYVLSFNGEIYNYKSLIPLFEGKWNFRTKGDTEVLLAGLVTFGESFLNRLEGMWAFVFWDSVEKKALLCRDRSGKKPLFYSSCEKSLMCASSLIALRELGGKGWQIDIDSAADYFRYGYSLPGYTFYKDVKEVKPAHLVVWDGSKVTRESRYWAPIINRFSGKYSQAKSTLRELLISSVEKRLVGDVEVGCFLSGGMDSSIIAAIATKELGLKSLKAFTIGFHEKTYDESVYAEEVANELKVERFVRYIKNWNPVITDELVGYHLGHPFNDPSIMPTAELAKFSSEYVKVALSGDGSDELFCGYERYKARAIISLISRLPKRLRFALSKGVSATPEIYGHHSRSMLKKLKLLIESSARWEETEGYVAPTFFSSKQYNECFPYLSEKGHEIDLGFCKEISEIKAMMVSDFHVYLPQDIHVKVDRSSMMHSLEVRAPFMDRALVEFAMSLPKEWCFSFYQNKKILADAFSDMLPNKVFKRRKQGFSVPIAIWMQESLGNDLEEMLNRSSGYMINRDAVKTMLGEHRSKKIDHSFRLWTIYQYLRWSESPGNLSNQEYN